MLLVGLNAFRFYPLLYTLQRGLFKAGWSGNFGSCCEYCVTRIRWAVDKRVMLLRFLAGLCILLENNHLQCSAQNP